MGHLLSVDGITFVEPLLFLNVQNFFYWSGTEFQPNTTGAWTFTFDYPGGLQSSNNKDADEFFAWAVRDGDSAPVPEPTTIFLFGLGLLGLAGVNREKNTRRSL